MAPAARCTSPAHFAERADGAGDDGRVEDELADSSPPLMPPRQHIVAAQPQHDGDGAEHQQR